MAGGVEIAAKAAPAKQRDRIGREQACDGHAVRGAEKDVCLFRSGAVDIEQQPEPTVLGADLVDEVAQRGVVLVVEGRRRVDLERAKARAIGVDELAMPSRNRDVRGLAEDLEHALRDALGDLARIEVTRLLEVAACRRVVTVALGHAGGLRVAAIRAGDQQRQRAAMARHEIGCAVLDLPHLSTPSAHVLQRPSMRARCPDTS